MHFIPTYYFVEALRLSLAGTHFSSDMGTFGCGVGLYCSCLFRRDLGTTSPTDLGQI